MIFSLLICIDSDDDRRMQQQLMQLFFQKIHQQRLDQITYGDTNGAICSGESSSLWEGIQCKKGTVVGIRYMRDFFGNVQLSYAPQTVQWLSITSCRQHFPINTRRLPRDAIEVNLHSNNIFGVVNFNTLPDKLEWFSMMDNNIQGKVTLLRLPKNMRSLNFSQNQVDQKIYYAKLPMDLTTIVVGKNPHSEDPFQIVPLTPADRSPHEKKIFRLSKY